MRNWSNFKLLIHTTCWICFTSSYNSNALISPILILVVYINGDDDNGCAVKMQGIPVGWRESRKELDQAQRLLARGRTGFFPSAACRCGWRSPLAARAKVFRPGADRRRQEVVRGVHGSRRLDKSDLRQGDESSRKKGICECRKKRILIRVYFPAFVQVFLTPFASASVRLSALSFLLYGKPQNTYSFKLSSRSLLLLNQLRPCSLKYLNSGIK